MRAGRTATGRRTRRGEILTTVVTALVGIVVLLWGVDWLARRAAETLLAVDLQQATGTVERPDVEVHGLWFLLQALRGRYDEVEITMEGLSSGPLRAQTVRAELTGVHLSFHDLILREADRVVVEYAEAEALLTYEDLDRYLGFTGRPLTVRPGDSGQIQITGRVPVLGELHTASAGADVGAEWGAIVVQPTRLETDAALDGTGELLLGERFAFRVPLDLLPFGQEVTDVEVTEPGVVVRTSGTDVVLDP